VTEKTIELDQHRGMAAQKATDLRRLMADVEANENALRSAAAAAAAGRSVPSLRRLALSKVRSARARTVSCREAP
jgi:hypothetical protein